jgi:hypothetical protein
MVTAADILCYTPMCILRGKGCVGAASASAC